MLDDDLVEVVANLRAPGGDHALVEAKRAAERLPKSVRETLSAFANTGGGVLVLGLDEASGFQATGVRDPAKMEADLGAVCADEMEPPVRPMIKTHRFEGVHLVIANRGQPRDDEEVVAGSTFADLDNKLVNRFVERLKEQRPNAFADLEVIDVLRRVKAMAGDSVTIAGLLSMGSYPQQFFPQLMVSFVHYPNSEGVDLNTGERFIDNVLAEGSIPIMMRDVLSALRRNMSRRATVHGAGRIDSWEYPEPALREAIVNALVHRDYSPQSRGTQVQVEMYPDRLVIRNPGGLFGPVTEDMLGDEGVSSARNATLLKLLEDVPLPESTRTVCENRGSGIRTMIRALRAASLSPPRFVDKIAFFRVTFPKHTLISDEVIAWSRKLGERGLTDSQCLGLAMAKAGDVLDNRSYRDATGVDSRRATLELGDLVARGLLIQTGGRRWARYELVEATAERIGGAQRRDRRKEVLEALGSGSLTRAEVAERVGLSGKTATRWLQVLRREGAVELIGGASRSPHVRYRRTDKVRLDE